MSLSLRHSAPPPARLVNRILKGTNGERTCSALAVVRSHMQIGICFEVFGCRAHEIGNLHPRGVFADERGNIDALGAVADAAKPEHRVDAAPALVKRDLGCGSDE